MLKENTKYEILTPTGYQPFKGINRLIKNGYRFKCGDRICDVSVNHTFNINGQNVKADSLKIGDSIQYKKELVIITDIEHLFDDYVYDPINVEGGNIYYGNGFVHHNCEFIGSSSTVIDADVIKMLMARHYSDPEIYELNNKFRVYEKPVDGAMYVMGCDVAKGTGEHYSTIQVFRIDSIKPIKMKQVAVFEDNFTDTYVFAEIVNRTCYYYNNAFIMCENNGEGSPVIMKLWWDFENENLVNEGNKTSKLGIRATGNTKPRAVLLMKKLIEDGSIEIVDSNTVSQLADYIDKGNNRFGGGNIDDDLVSAFYWACFVLEMDLMDEKFEFKANDLTEDDAWGMLTDFQGGEDDWSWLTQ